MNDFAQVPLYGSRVRYFDNDVRFLSLVIE